MSQENGVKTVRKKRKSHKGSFVFGVIIIIFAVVGVCCTAFAAANGIKSVFNSDRQKQTYEKFLYPVVMLDPENFDDVSKADMQDLLNAAILSLLTDEKASPYDYDFVEGETSGYAVPQETVEKAFADLFGTDVKPVHQSVECSTCVFEYQSAAKRYVIPLTGYDAAYTPKVYKIKKNKEGTTELTVGYIAYGDSASGLNGDSAQPEPSKYRKIILREDGSGYFITSIKNADASEFSVTAVVTTVKKTTAVKTTAPSVSETSSQTQTSASETTSAQTTAATTTTTTTKK